MKILIQNRHSGLYFKDDGQWTECLREARNFENMLSAMVTGKQIGLADLQIVLRYSRAIGDVKLPVEHTPANGVFAA